LIGAGEARIAVAAHLGGIEADPGDAAVIVEDSTIERPWGWVFFYESRTFLDTGDNSARFAGNAPIIVERETGQLLDTGTARPIEFYLSNYEATGDPHKRPGRRIEIDSTTGSIQSAAAAKLVSKAASISLGEAKRGLDSVAASDPFQIALPSPERAFELCSALEPLGFVARQLPEPAV
jgi:hypothetical protein